MGVDHRSPHIGAAQDPLTLALSLGGEREPEGRPLTPTLSRQGRGNLRGRGNLESKARRAGAPVGTPALEKSSCVAERYLPSKLRS